MATTSPQTLSEITATVTLRSGEKKDFCSRIQCADGKLTHKALRDSLHAVQTEVNEFLTVQVDLEKGTTTRQPNSSTSSDSLDSEDGSDEDDEGTPSSGQEEQGQGDAAEEESRESQEPPEKKPKK